MKTFSEKLKKIEEILEKLNENGIEIEESLELYEQGMKLISECEKQLETSKGKLKILDLNNSKAQYVTGSEDLGVGK
ncbi:MAG: exodeoxyribonuclease VII small subunit [Eubacteriales bacterium]